MSPATSLALGFTLILAGFFLPFFMVLQILESSMMLNISAYGASLVGLGFGLYGVSQYSSSRGSPTTSNIERD
jgi:hypothetical protein